MSTQALIEINFSTFYQDNVIIPLIKMLLAGGWILNNNEIMKTLVEEDRNKKPINVILTWQNTTIGGSFIFQTNEKLSIDLTLNRKMISGLNDYKIIDSNWYLTRILSIFYENNIEVYNFSLSELFNEKMEEQNE